MVFLMSDDIPLRHKAIKNYIAGGLRIILTRMPARRDHDARILTPGAVTGTSSTTAEASGATITSNSPLVPVFSQEVGRRGVEIDGSAAARRSGRTPLRASAGPETAGFHAGRSPTWTCRRTRPSPSGGRAGRPERSGSGASWTCDDDAFMFCTCQANRVLVRRDA